MKAAGEGGSRRFAPCRKSGRRIFLCGAVAAALAEPGLAQGLPGGIVRVLVGFPAGGGTDVMARLIAEQIRKRGNLRGIVVGTGRARPAPWPARR